MTDLRPDSDGDAFWGIAVTAAMLKQEARPLADASLEDDSMSIRLDALRRADVTSKLGAYHYLPVLHVHGDKVGRTRKLRLAVLGLVLDRVQGLQPAVGLVARPRGQAGKGPTGREALPPGRASAGRTEATPAGRRVAAADAQRALPAVRVPPAVPRAGGPGGQPQPAEGISEKEVKGLARRGIFTLTQLAHNFRPRRKGKRAVSKTHHRYHALRALAIRDKRIYLFGTPPLPVSPVQIYLDVESTADDEFISLIGMAIVRGDIETRVSFWADGKDQEADIFQRFLDEVTHHDDFAVFSYGTYERAFLKRMRVVAGDPKQVDRFLHCLVHVLSLDYAHVCFPCYSNGLKDVARCLGFSWTDPEASGLLSVLSRARWESTRDDVWKRALLNANL
jgi:hypothetical protein